MAAWSEPTEISLVPDRELVINERCTKCEDDHRLFINTEFGSAL